MNINPPPPKMWRKKNKTHS